MIEEYDKIYDCETKLLSYIESGKLIGEISLSHDDVNKLGGLLKKEYSIYTKTAPACLSYFLVWKGILGYKEGDYWNSIGILDTAQQVELGEKFIEFLKIHKLPMFDIENSHKYVTPILAHGMIPDSCLNDYFEKILIPFVEDLADPNDIKEIKFCLENKRKDDIELNKVKKDIEDLNNKKSEIPNKLVQLENLINVWDELDKIKELEININNKNKYLSEIQHIQEQTDILDRKYNFYCFEYENEIKNIDLKRNELKNQKHHLDDELKKIDDFSEEHKKIQNNLKINYPDLDVLEKEKNKLELDKKNKKYSISEKERFKIELEQTKEKINVFNKRKNTIIEPFPYIDKPIKRFLLYGKSIAENFLINSVKMVNYVKEMIFWLKNKCKDDIELNKVKKDIEDLNNKKAEISNKLVQLENLINVWDELDRIKELEINITNKNKYLSEIQHIQEQTDILDIKYNSYCVEYENEIKNIDLKRNELKNQKHYLDDELKKIDDFSEEHKKIQNNLKINYPDLDVLEKEKNKLELDKKDKKYCISEKEHFEIELEQTKEKINLFNKRKNTIIEPFPYIDKPVKRFLLYGESIAETFLFNSVKMVLQKEKKHIVGKVELPNRIIIKFNEWWENKKENEFVNKEKRFKNPIIHYDLGELKVNFQPQLLESNSQVSLVINSEIKPLKLYKNNALFETKEINFPISPQEIYEFKLKIGNEIIKNYDSIFGVSKSHQFMVFDYNTNRLIKKEELSNQKVWIISKIKPDIQISEECGMVGNWSGYTAYAAIYSNKSSISNNILYESLIYGKKLENVTSNNNEIYINEPPSIRIPFISSDEINNCFIHIIFHNILKDSLHYRFNDLTDIIKIDKENNVFEIPLSNEKLIGNNFGEFEVRYKNEIHNINNSFRFCVLPYLKFKFNKDIYLPEQNLQQVYLDIDYLKEIVFKPKPPAKIINHKPNLYTVDSNTSEHSINGIIEYDSISLPINIPIPRLTWSIEKLNYSNTNKIVTISEDEWEKALYDELLLIVNLPDFYDGKAKLSLHSMVQYSKIIYGVTTFDLRSFSDTLRANIKPINQFKLTINNLKLLKNILLFNVEKWQITDIECKKINQILKISWKEIGKINDKKISFWKLEKKPILLYEEILSKTDTVAEIPINSKMIYNTNYQISITKNCFENDVISKKVYLIHDWNFLKNVRNIINMQNKIIEHLENNGSDTKNLKNTYYELEYSMKHYENYYENNKLPCENPKKYFKQYSNKFLDNITLVKNIDDIEIQHILGKDLVLKIKEKYKHDLKPN